MDVRPSNASRLSHDEYLHIVRGLGDREIEFENLRRARTVRLPYKPRPTRAGFSNFPWNWAFVVALLVLDAYLVYRKL